MRKCTATRALALAGEPAATIRALPAPICVCVCVCVLCVCVCVVCLCVCVCVVCVCVCVVCVCVCVVCVCVLCVCVCVCVCYRAHAARTQSHKTHQPTHPTTHKCTHKHSCKQTGRDQTLEERRVGVAVLPARRTFRCCGSAEGLRVKACVAAQENGIGQYTNPNLKF